MLRAGTWLAVLFALPVSLMAIRAVTQDLIELSDPCVAWGVSDSGGYGSFHHRRNDTGMQWSFHDETRAWAVIRMLGFPAAGVRSECRGCS